MTGSEDFGSRLPLFRLCIFGSLFCVSLCRVRFRNQPDLIRAGPHPETVGLHSALSPFVCKNPAKTGVVTLDSSVSELIRLNQELLHFSLLLTALLVFSTPPFWIFKVDLFLTCLLNPLLDESRAKDRNSLLGETEAVEEQRLTV